MNCVGIPGASEGRTFVVGPAGARPARRRPSSDKKVGGAEKSMKVAADFPEMQEGKFAGPLASEVVGRHRRMDARGPSRPNHPNGAQGHPRGRDGNNKSGN